MNNVCQHCDEAPCISKCTSNAIYKRDDGIVIIDPEKCTGCRTCVEACPSGAVYFNRDMNIAQKCTMCAHLLDKGWKEPRCVDACPTGALLFGEESEMLEEIETAEVLKPECGTKPRVYYRNLPNKYFVAGAIYDPDGDECLEEATITLIDSETSRQVLQTDVYGDFWFEKKEAGEYSLEIEKAGYVSRTIGPFRVEKDINVGDIELYAK